MSLVMLWVRWSLESGFDVLSLLDCKNEHTHAHTRRESEKTESVCVTERGRERRTEKERKRDKGREEGRKGGREGEREKDRDSGCTCGV